MAAQRVMVTGLGLLSPGGSSLSGVTTDLLAGRSWLTAERDRGITELGVRATARVDDSGIPLSYRERRRMDRAAALGLVAARTALDDADLSGVLTYGGSARVAVSLSGGMIGLSSVQDTLDAIARHDPDAVGPHTITRIMPNSLAALVASEIGAGHGTYAPVSACASSSEAIAQGYDLIRADRVDIVVAGGAESLMDARTIASFVAMRAISRSQMEPTEISRPFDSLRSGFVMGEGAAVLVLESDRHARARGARTLGEIKGVGVTSDGYHAAAPRPDGSAQASAIESALREASLAGGAALDVVFAHATSTRAGDDAELLALERTLAGSSTPVTALKGHTGHLLGASGAVSVAVALESLRVGSAPSILNLDAPDRETPVVLARSECARIERRSSPTALVNSFGFGGQNVSLAVGL